MVQFEKQHYSKGAHHIGVQAILVAIGIFTLIVVGMFIFAFLKKEELNDEQSLENIQTKQVDDTYGQITRIDAKHYYKNGLHTLVGEVILPTLCDLLDTRITVAESMPEQVWIDFTVINNSKTCQNSSISQRFRVDATASAEAVLRARFMGRNIELNLIPAAPDENPEDFELFIKG